MGRAMRSTAQDREAASADGREHQRDHRPDVLHRALRLRARRASSTACTSARSSSHWASAPASRRSPRLSWVASATSRVRSWVASSSASSRSSPPQLGYSCWPRPSSSSCSSWCSCSGPPACSASSWVSGHDRHGASRRGPRPTAGGRRARSAASARHRSITIIVGMTLVAAILPLIVTLPPFNGFSEQTVWIDGFANAGHVRPAGAGPQHRRRHGRSARPGLCGVLRHRCLYHARTGRPPSRTCTSRSG